MRNRQKRQPSRIAERRKTEIRGKGFRISESSSEGFFRRRRESGANSCECEIFIFTAFRAVNGGMEIRAVVRKFLPAGLFEYFGLIYIFYIFHIVFYSVILHGIVIIRLADT